MKGIEESSLHKYNLSDAMKYYSQLSPSFIVFLTPHDRNLDKVKLADNFITQCHEKLPTNIQLQLPNGHQRHVHYEKSDNTLVHMSTFVSDVRAFFGSIMIFSYVGNGIFSVTVLKDDFCEVIYFKVRTVPRGPVYDQDLVHGIGWKFIVSLDDPSIEYGDIPIPGRFCRIFGKYLPPTVFFHLRDGTAYIGSFLKDERIVNGLENILVQFHLGGRDKLLFTYFGSGNFLITMFDGWNVEQHMNAYLNSSGTTGSNEEQKLENPEEGVDIGNIRNVSMSFSSVMTKSNVDNSTHGPYINGDVNPSNRKWVSGDRVTLRTAEGDWKVVIVVANKIARFSSGWNEFSSDNNVRFNETLVFSYFEEEDGIFFLVNFASRI